MFDCCQKCPNTGVNKDENIIKSKDPEREPKTPSNMGKGMCRMTAHIPRTLGARRTVIPVGVPMSVFASAHYKSWRLVAPPENQTVLGSSGTLWFFSGDFWDDLPKRHFTEARLDQI